MNKRSFVRVLACVTAAATVGLMVPVTAAGGVGSTVTSPALTSTTASDSSSVASWSVTSVTRSEALGMVDLPGPNDAVGPTVRSGVGKWSKRITYRNLTARPKMVDAAFASWRKAFKGLKFVKKTSGKANITIRAKNCPANTTPCAYYPDSGGTVYMGSYWKTGGEEDNPYDDLLQPLLMHEIGHAIGLTHNTRGCSIMHHYVNDWRRECGYLTWPEGQTYCAPQKTDAKKIARLYKVKVRPGVGTCTFEEVFPESLYSY